MSITDPNVVLDAIKDSLEAALPNRSVRRSLLLDPSSESNAVMNAGVICIVTEGGGQFANYRGREAQLGQLNARLVGFVKVAEKSAPEEVERAELALLTDLLGWLAAPSVPGLDVVYPGEWAQSKQLEHPYGWLTLSLIVKP